MQVAEFRYFLAVIEAGSFGRAAHALQLQVSTLSRAVGRLEDRLGVTLIERTSTGIRLTSPGRLALRHVRRVLVETNALKEILGRSSAGEIGDIRLGFHLPPVNSLLADLLLEWRKIHPGVSVTPHEAGESTLHAALTSRRIDAALVPDFLLHCYETGSPVYSELLMAVLPTGHHLADKQALRWTDLENEPLLAGVWGMDPTGRDFFANRLPIAGLRVFEASNMTVLAFVRAGYGITIAPQTYSTLNLPGLTFVPIAEENAHFEVSLVWRPETEDPVIGKFVTFMRDQTKARCRTLPFRVASESPYPPP